MEVVLFPMEFSTSRIVLEVDVKAPFLVIFALCLYMHVQGFLKSVFRDKNMAFGI